MAVCVRKAHPYPIAVSTATRHSTPHAVTHGARACVLVGGDASGPRALRDGAREALQLGVCVGKHAKPIDKLPLLPPPPPVAPKGKRKAAAEPATKAAKKTKAVTHFDVARILEEAGKWGGHSRWFLVEWDHAGYTPSWEAWRSPGCGQPGSPVLQWLPLRSVSMTDAFKEWEAAKATAEAAEAEA